MRPANRHLSPVMIVGSIVFAVALIGVVFSLLLPLTQKVTFTHTSSISGPENRTIEVKCGSPLKSGPPAVGDSSGDFRQNPCQDAIRSRRTIAGSLGVLCLVAAAVVVVAGRSRADTSAPAVAERDASRA